MVCLMQPYPAIGNLVLASASPRRRELLSSLGLEFKILAPSVDETLRDEEHPIHYAQRLATEKASAVATDPGMTVIGADTIVVLDGRILGKPANEEEAFEMLSRLSGKQHEVTTAVSVIHGDRTVEFSVTTDVVFRQLAVPEINAYIATGCPMDKAGAYAIQGGAAHMVRSINGSYTNVVGLPLCELHETLASI